MAAGQTFPLTCHLLWGAPEASLALRFWTGSDVFPALTDRRCRHGSWDEARCLNDTHQRANCSLPMIISHSDTPRTFGPKHVFHFCPKTTFFLFFFFNDISLWVDNWCDSVNCEKAQGAKQLHGFPQALKGVCFPLWSNTTDEAASNYRRQTPTEGEQRPPTPTGLLSFLLVFLPVNFIRFFFFSLSLVFTADFSLTVNLRR